MTDENFFDIVYTVKGTHETREMYERWAKVYDRDVGENEYQQPTRCAQALLGQLPDMNSKILDVGCGTGLSGMALHTAGYAKIDGCDLSQAMLNKASELEIYDRLFSCDLNLPPLDVANNTYDALTAVGVFSFGHIQPDAMNDLLRIVKPGAPIIICLNDHFYNEGSLTAKLEALEAAGDLSILNQEHGDHLPKKNLKGWVLTLQKSE